LTFDYQGTSLTVNSRYYTFLAGPRFAYRKGKVTPFVHGLFGLDRSPVFGDTTYDPANQTSISPYGNGFAALAGGGFDYAISRRLTFRSQGDYLFHQTAFATPTANNFRVMAAIVFTFGQTESSAYARRHTNPTVMAQSHSIPAADQRVSEPVAVPAPNPDVENAQVVQPAAEPVVAAVQVPAEPQIPMPMVPAASPTLVAKVEPPVINTTPTVVSQQPPPPAAIVPVPVVAAKAVAPPPVITPAPAVVSQPTAPAPVQAVASASIVTGPNSVVISQGPAQWQASSQQEESLGDVARRYREKKQGIARN
jgi:hypothetical protein